MKADFTRNSFHPEKHFARVLMQQGRVQLDADWNEQTTILLHYLHALAADIIGPYGGPADNCGFLIQPLTVKQAVSGDFQITAGRYYVDGILCEIAAQPVAVALVPGKNNQIVVASRTVDGLQFAKDQYVELFDKSAPPKTAFVQIIDNPVANTLTVDQDVSALNPASLTRVTTYLNQPDLALPVPKQPLANASYFVYLDVWERVITYVEDQAISEIALNGADTAARTKVVCQVKVGPQPADGADPVALLDPPNRGFLRARSAKSMVSTDPCTISPNARYSGPENQLYRVEIHSGGSLDPKVDSLKPTFKFSRENGAVVFPIVSAASANSFVLESLGRDDRFGLAEGDWVEVQDDDSVLLNRADNLLQVQSIDRSTIKVVLSGTPSSKTTGAAPARHPLLRRWDQQFADASEGGLEQGSDNAALIVEAADGWLDLENGVQIQFQPPLAGEIPAQYRTGDYWLIPARVATGDVEWPTEAASDSQGNPVQSPLALPPQGITHHYAPLANITVDAAGVHVRTPLTKMFPPFPPK
jgi:hypothetical protein